VDKGHFLEADEKLGEARALALAHDTRARFGMAGIAVSSIAAYKGRGLAELGRDEEAVRTAQDALDIAEEVGHAFSISAAKLHLALTHIMGGRFETALPLLKDTVTITEATRLHIYQPMTLGALGYAIARTGSTTEGIRLLNASLEHARMLHHSLPRPRILSWMSELALETKQIEAAIGCAEQALNFARSTSQLSEQGWAHLALGRAFAATSRTAEAFFHLSEAESLGRQLSMKPLIEHCLDCRRSIAQAEAGS